MEQILELFLFEHKLKFNEIEKRTKLRSNKLTYHLNKLVRKGFIEKEKSSYKLSETAESIIPYITKKNPTLPIILIALENKGKIFLHKRVKRPYKDKLGLPGGRIVLGEKIHEAVKRIMKEKFNLSCKLKKINSVSLEHVKNRLGVVHSFLLILVTAETKENLEYFNIKENKEKIIHSDYELIKEDLKKEIRIKDIYSKS